MTLRWTPQASADVDSIQIYIARDNKKAAIRMGDRIQAAGERLRSQPWSGRSGRVPGTRELAIARTSYLLVYRVFDGRVEVLRVLHGAQSWPPETSE